MSNGDSADQATVLRERALSQLKKQREFHRHVLAYVLVNTFIVVIWAVTGFGFFWPVFPIVGWGVGLAMHGWDVYRGEDFSEEQVRREMGRLAKRTAASDRRAS